MKRIFTIGKTTVTTRPCKKDDYSFVFGLVKKTLFPFVAKYYTPSKKMFDERFQKDYKERTILMVRSKRIGFYHIHKVDNILEVNGIFFSPAYQRKGIGTVILSSFERLKVSKITLQVWENNPARYWYKKLGYVIAQKKDHKLYLKKLV